MSATNDASKSAGEAPKTKEQPATPVSPTKKPGWVLPASVAGGVLLTFFVVWGLVNQGHDQEVRAREQERLPGAPLSRTTAPDAVTTEKIGVVAVGQTTIQETTRTNPAFGGNGGLEPKLQGIVYNPGSPSATISGKMVFVGEKVGSWKVMAIDRSSATLISGGETRVLRLGE